MSIISVSDLRVDLGANTILKDVTFTVGEGERWGIVGRNGAGKTTLFRVLTGVIQPVHGAVARRPGLRLALLDQNRDFNGARSVWDAAAISYGEAMALERSLEEQGARLAELGDRVTESDLATYGRDQDRYAHAGGYSYHARVDAVLQGLGFDPDEAKARQVASLSGGERGRVGLAGQLAAPADIVLLDEPTNHLDLDTTDWLKQYLHEFGETVLMISHDRAFLDDTVDHVLHVSNGTAAAYRGGYSSFVTQLAERQLALERQVSKQQKMIAREEEYIRRNIAGQNSSQAKGRRTRLARLPRLSPPPGEAGAMSLRFECADRGGDQVVIADRLKVTVGERVLVDEFTAVARRGDVIAIVGPNGSGKSTLLATLLGSRAAASGTARIGGSVTAEWFRQDLAQVPRDRTIYDCIADLRSLWNRGQVQGHLGAFGFSGDQVLWNTSTLSGGERSRVALAIMTLRHANLLVLDEPTNHLDVESIEAIEDAIEDFEGTVLLVSHDRAFLRELATRVWAFDGTQVEDFRGPFVEWERRHAERVAQRLRHETATAAAARDVARLRDRKSIEARRKEQDSLRAARRDVESLEQDVHAKEAEVLRLQSVLNDPTLYDGSGDVNAAVRLQRELSLAQRALDAAMEQWARAAEGLDDPSRTG
ncbi:MAG: putative ABC transporter ATP-binding protein YheS [Gemmatimonadaceae bacterium]|nr:putative ABC transporter ATP-binding protein YheS [Gemmatimonadaceae bacterium]